MSVSRRAVVGSLAVAMGASFVIANCESGNDRVADTADRGHSADNCPDNEDDSSGLDERET